jgi:hypothetical protein
METKKVKILKKIKIRRKARFIEFLSTIFLEKPHGAFLDRDFDLK